MTHAHVEVGRSIKIVVENSLSYKIKDVNKEYVNILLNFKNINYFFR